jgi:superfamily I DNA and/or RNA helicase
MLFNGLPPDQREKLTQQHRMHPQICEVVSNVFYGGEIKDDPETAGKLACLYDREPAFLANKAVLWLDLPHLEWLGGRSTQEEREPGGYSYRNRHEADTLHCFLNVMLRHSPTNLPVKETKLTLAALSPYKYQINALRTLFRQWSCPEWLEVEKPGAFTSTSFQGREADIILLSMVRNNTNFDMGFLKRQQMNVALSRARRLLVVVGCFEMLRHRAQSSDATDSFVPLLVRHLERHVVAAQDIFQELQR